jgi:hypothetical protein
MSAEVALLAESLAWATIGHQERRSNPVRILIALLAITTAPSSGSLPPCRDWLHRREHG